MDQIVLLAAKSVLIAGAVLILLRLMRSRSASERSWIAHIGLAAIMVLPLALLLPQIHLPAPSFMDQAAGPIETRAPSLPAVTAQEPATTASTFPVTATETAAPASSIDWAFWAYAVPAGLLLLLTLTALLRLVVLKAKANVLVEPSWLSALAHAQRRMGFKYGTALLTSDELSSPISWGLVRPVILLNSEAANAKGEAEAIIAHELAHVAHLDWLKLLLARVTVSLFWYNPLVWLLAREAHQLREEAADDAVLASNVEDTEYAKLLVGIARHECRGLLIGAHGVAPARGSLARRIARVLDSTSPRGPVARSFAAGVFVGALAIGAPLAAITFTPDRSAQDKLVDTAPKSQLASKDAVGSVGSPTNGLISGVVSDAISTAVTSATSNVWTDDQRRDFEKDWSDGEDFEVRSPSGATVTRRNGITVSRAPNGSTVTVYPADARGRQKIVTRAPSGATTTTFANSDDVTAQFIGPQHRKPKTDGVLERAMEAKAMGLTPEYASSIRAAAPWLSVDHDSLIEFKALGVTPGYIRELTSAFGRIDADAITEAAALRLDTGYARRMAAAGYRGSFDDYVEMKALGITPEYAQSFQRRGIKVGSVDKLVELKANRIEPDDVSTPPTPPAPPRLPGKN